VVGISQSGQSPDIVSVLEEGHRQGCLTLAITNAPDSPLAKAADFVLDILSGPELATAATKTYTGELMVLAMLSAALNCEEDCWQQLAQVPQWAAQALTLDTAVGQAAQRYRYMQQCVVIGRGYNYASAFEWALKLKELTYTIAEPYSSADFLHGPIAMVGGGFPVLAVAPPAQFQILYSSCSPISSRISTPSSWSFPTEMKPSCWRNPLSACRQVSPNGSPPWSVSFLPSFLPTTSPWSRASNLITPG